MVDLDTDRLRNAFLRHVLQIEAVLTDKQSILEQLVRATTRNAFLEDRNRFLEDRNLFLEKKVSRLQHQQMTRKATSRSPAKARKKRKRSRR